MKADNCPVHLGHERFMRRDEFRRDGQLVAPLLEPMSGVTPMRLGGVGDRAQEGRIGRVGADDFDGSASFQPAGLSMQAGSCADQRSQLLLEDLFHVSDLLLDFAFHLFGGTAVLQIGIANHFACLFLHLADRFLDRAFCFVLGA